MIYVFAVIGRFLNFLNGDGGFTGNGMSMKKRGMF